MARSNKFLNQVKGYSAGNDFTQKQSNATTELVKRLDENEKISSQELNNNTEINEVELKEKELENIEKTTITENIETDKTGVSNMETIISEQPQKRTVSKINKNNFEGEEYIKTTISIDAVLFNTFKYIAKTNKTTITDYLIELLLEDKKEKTLNPTVVDFTKRIENKNIRRV